MEKNWEIIQYLRNIISLLYLIIIVHSWNTFIAIPADQASLFNILGLREVCCLFIYLMNKFSFNKKKLNWVQTYYSQTFQVLSHCISTVEKIEFLSLIGTGHTGENYVFCPRSILHGTGSSQHPQRHSQPCHKLKYWGWLLAV